MALPQSSPLDEILPTGGTTGLDHASTGTCQFHTSVMLAPGELCPICAQQTQVVRTVPQRQPPTIPIVENLSGPTEIDPGMLRGHAAMGGYN